MDLMWVLGSTVCFFIDIWRILVQTSSTLGICIVTVCMRSVCVYRMYTHIVQCVSSMVYHVMNAYAH